MTSHTKAIERYGVRRAVAEAMVFLAIYVAGVCTVVYQIALAAGYVG